jgi:hypothetical protein
MIGALGFLSPLMLLALATLPAIWLLLRLTPPRAVEARTKSWFIFRVPGRENTPARTPWWLTLIRLLLVGAIIVALAEPALRPDVRLTSGSGPLLVVLDNGWDSAPDFAARRTAAEAAIEEAARDARPVALAATAEARAGSLAFGDAEAARRRLHTIEPQPYLPDRAAMAERIAAAFEPGAADVLWLAGALDDGGGAELAEALSQAASAATLMQAQRPLSMLLPPENAADAVRVPVARVPGAAGEATVVGFDQEGRRIVEGVASLDASGRGVAEIVLPAEIRNAVTRFGIAGEESAGAVQLLDSRWRRKAVGLVAGESAGASQPLLEPLTYVERALAPTADLMRSNAASTAAATEALIERGASIVVLTEIGTLPPETTAKVVEWVNGGGTLLRFASPNLAATTDEELLPVRLRQGERALGGSLSWEEPQPIGDFPDAGPFAGLAVPADVRINRQVLADPSGLREAEVWAELTDGTPLVTAARRGDGRIVLFHVTADPRWSNLPLSGAFVDMLNAIVEQAGQAPPPEDAAERAADAPANSAPWRPLRVLDGYGDLVAPEAPVTLVADIAAAQPSAATPPGVYDRDGTLFALNAVAGVEPPPPLVAETIGWTARTATLEPRQAEPLGHWLLAFAAALAALDGLAVLYLSGRMARGFARPATLALLFVAFSAFSSLSPAAAQEETFAQALEATTQTQLAYVVTGNGELDETSRAGLQGLSMYLADRTAFEPGEPAAVDISTDELAFYALLYWPIDAAQDVPSAETMAKIDTFMKNGGTILFDTRDAGGFSASGFGAATPENRKLRDILAFIDVPPLEPVPPDHVLTKAFYLLADFPGRWDNSELWVESLSDAPQDPSRPARGGDGVSPIMITGNDLAAAWAIDADGMWLYPTVPSDPRQRELAFRAGVNIVMYALTGNYKADQVHVPALLERLGQ